MVVVRARLGTTDPHDTPFSFFALRVRHALLAASLLAFRRSLSLRVAHALTAACVPLLWVSTTGSDMRFCVLTKPFDATDGGDGWMSVVARTSSGICRMRTSCGHSDQSPA